MMKSRDHLKAFLLSGSLLHAVLAYGEPSRTLTLKPVDSDSLVSTPVWKAVAGEVVRVFSGIGVEVDWTEPTTTTLPEAGQAQLLVYLRASRPEQLGLGETVLGAVLSNRAPQRVLFVYMPTIAEVAVALLGGMLGVEDERHLATAIARVIVHETFHAIAPELAHADAGLTSANLTRDVLVRGKAEVARESARVFSRQLAVLWDQASAETGGTSHQ